MNSQGYIWGDVSFFAFAINRTSGCTKEKIFIKGKKEFG